MTLCSTNIEYSYTSTVLLTNSIETRNDFIIKFHCNILDRFASGLLKPFFPTNAN